MSDVLAEAEREETDAAARRERRSTDDPRVRVWRLSELDQLADPDAGHRKTWKMTEEQKRQAIHLRDGGVMSLREIAKMFGVSHEAIRILKRRSA